MAMLMRATPALLVLLAGCPGRVCESGRVQACACVGGVVTQELEITHNGSTGTLVLGDVRLETDSEEITITQPQVTELEPGEYLVRLTMGDEVQTTKLVIEKHVPGYMGR